MISREPSAGYRIGQKNQNDHQDSGHDQESGSSRMRDRMIVEFGPSRNNQNRPHHDSGRKSQNPF